MPTDGLSRKQWEALFALECKAKGVPWHIAALTAAESYEEQRDVSPELAANKCLEARPGLARASSEPT